MMPLASSAATIMTIGFTSEEKNLLDLRTFVDQHISPALLSLNGVADVNVFGGYERQLSIILDKDKLLKYFISLESIIDHIKASNLIVSGSIQTPNQELQIVSNNVIPIEKIREINLLNDNGQYFKLKDIATIKFTAAKQIRVIRQSKSSDKKCALGNETVPANPAASVTIVIALFAFPPIL